MSLSLMQVKKQVTLFVLVCMDCALVVEVTVAREDCVKAKYDQWNVLIRVWPECALPVDIEVAS